MSSYVSTRSVGDARVTIVHEGAGRWAPRLEAPEAEWRAAMPEADAAGAVDMAFNVVHVALGAASLLIDCPFDDPRPNHPHDAMLELRRSPGLAAGLALVGVRPEDVTHVVLSHPHGDHVAGATVERGRRRVPRFPNARYLINRLDWAPTRGAGDPFGVAATHLGALEERGVLDLVDGDCEVVPGITMVHAPGETVGHAVVRVASAGQTFWDLTDLFHFPIEVAHPAWVPWGCDAATSQRTRRRLFEEIIPGRALATFAHARFPGWGRIVGTLERPEWRWEPPG